MPLVAAPVGALAATVSGEVSGGKAGTSVATFKGGQGETNEVTVTRSQAGEVSFADSGAAVTATGRCRQVAANEAVCPPGSTTFVYLEDGDDRLEPGAADFAFGGAGDDVLIGSVNRNVLRGDAGADFIDARDGDDSLEGGGGADTIDAGPGADTVIGDGEGTSPGRDVLGGGDGRDAVSYVGHTVPVRVDLSQPGTPAGAEGENDEISGFESAGGGSARNELIGTDGPNGLDLSSGGGLAVGGGGNDSIGVGTAIPVESIDAVVDAGPGHDRIYALYSKGARIGCGPDFDEVVGWRLGTLAADCEIIAPVDFVDIDDPVLRPYPRLRGDKAVFRIPCPRDINSVGPCRGRVLLRDTAGRAVGKRRYTTREGAKPSVGVTLDRAARKRMARPGGLEVRIDLLISKGFSERESGEWSVVLRP